MTQFFFLVLSSCGCMTSHIKMLTMVPSCPTRSWSLRQAWIRRLMALIRSVSVSIPKYPYRGSCWRGAGAVWSHNCWSPQNMTIEKRFVFTKIVRCFYIKLAWKKFRLAIHMDFFLCFVLFFFPQALRALLAMAPVCLKQYRSDSSLMGSLLTLRDQYQDMVQSEMILGEENGYFAEMIELIDALQVQIKWQRNITKWLLKGPHREERTMQDYTWNGLNSTKQPTTEEHVCCMQEKYEGRFWPKQCRIQSLTTEKLITKIWFWTSNIFGVRCFI